MRLAILMAFSVTTAAAAHPDGGHSSNDLEHFSAKAADLVARRDLLSVLQPVEKPQHGMLRRLHGVSFMTRAYATAYRGVCGRDELTLWYAAPGDRPNDPHANLTPYSVTVGSSFRVEKLASADEQSVEPGRPEGAAACAMVAAKADGWLAAPSADSAVDALHALVAAQHAVADRTVSLACYGKSCSPGALALLRPQDILSVERCDQVTDQSCFRLQTDQNGDELTIMTELSRRAASPGAADPVRVYSVRWVTDRIIVT